MQIIYNQVIQERMQQHNNAKTVFEEKIAVFIASVKTLEQEGSISPSSFYRQLPNMSHTFLALSTQWMSSPSRKWRLGVSSRFHLTVLCLVWVKRIRRQGEFRILSCNPNGGNLVIMTKILEHLPDF